MVRRGDYSYSSPTSDDLYTNPLHKQQCSTPDSLLGLSRVSLSPPDLTMAHESVPYPTNVNSPDGDASLDGQPGRYYEERVVITIPSSIPGAARSLTLVEPRGL